MRRGINLLVLFLSLLFTSQITAQDATKRAERIEKLRQQVIDLQAKEAELRARSEQLNEAMKPENIERSLAGIGSTRPEELREHRRRMLSIERDGVLKQLQSVQESRSQLESEISIAESEGYVSSGQPAPAASTQMFVAESVGGSRRPLFVMATVGLLALLILAGGAVAIARRRSA